MTFSLPGNSSALRRMVGIVLDAVKSPLKSKRAQGQPYLQQLLQQFPDTEAAAQAKGML